MCLNPVRIKNKSLSYRAGIDKAYFTVPCGHCEECVSMKRDDMFVRMAYEFNRYNSKSFGGCMVFVTFTYNQFAIPKIDTSSVDFEPLRRYLASVPLEREDIIDFDGYVSGTKPLFLPRIIVNCFDKNKFRLLFKELNNHDLLPDWIQKLVPEYDRSKPIKHFVVCELGDEKLRPHVHVGLFLPWKITNKDTDKLANLRRILEFCFAERRNKKTVDKDVLYYLEHSETAQRALKRGDFVRYERGALGDYLIYNRRNGYHKTPVYMYIPGYVKYSTRNPPVVEDINGMQYLTKYLYKHKDNQYKKDDEQEKKVEEKPNVLWLEKFVKKLGGVDNFPETVKPAVKALKNAMPFSLISNDFGTSLLDEYDFNLETMKFNSQDSENKFLEAYCNGLKDIHVPNQDRKYCVPKYILRRLFYENRHYVEYYSADYKSITYLTEFGVKATNQKLKLTRRRLIVNYKKFFKPEIFRFCDDNFIREFESRYEIPFKSTWYELRSYCHFSALAEYILFLRDVQVPKAFEHLKDAISFDEMDEFKEKVLNIKQHQFDFDGFFDHDGKYLYGVFPLNPYSQDLLYRDGKPYLFNHLPIFLEHKFEDIILFVDSVMTMLRSAVKTKFVDSETSQQYVRDFYNTMYY